MQTVIISNEAQREELLNGRASFAEVAWINSLDDLPNYSAATAIIDLLFQNSEDRIAALLDAPDRLVIINSVHETLGETHIDFIRIAGWNTFLKGSFLEGACLAEDRKAKAEKALAQLGKKIEWLPDTPGFITPRVVSMIVNEAYLALEEGVSTLEEIDTAMKLGTNYPYGPIEWGDRIGLQNIVGLLKKLATVQPRYTPAALLVQETDKAI